MEDISVPPESESNRPRGRGGTGSVSLLADHPPEISVTSDVENFPGVPYTIQNTSSSEPNHENPNSEGFLQDCSPFDVLLYDAETFPPFCGSAASDSTPASAYNEKESMDVEDPHRDPSAPGSDDVIRNGGKESEGVDDAEEDWSLVSDRQDGHSTPSGFLMASSGTPSIPDDLMSFPTDQDDESSDENDFSSDDVSSFHDHVLSDHDEASFYDYPDDVLSGFGVLEQGNSTAVRSKTLSLGYLRREDTLEEDTEASEQRMYYDQNDNEECMTPLGDPLLSSIVFGINEDRTGTEDINHDTADDEEDMETPRAPSTDHINNVTSQHSWCLHSHDDPDMSAGAGGSRGLYLSNVPQEDFPKTYTSPESLQEESFFDSGNFQRVDDVYECYPTKLQSKKRNSGIKTYLHRKLWRKCSSKRGKAKRKSKNRRRWKQGDHLTDVNLF